MTKSPAPRDGSRTSAKRDYENKKVCRLAKRIKSEAGISKDAICEPPEEQSSGGLVMGIME